MAWVVTGGAGYIGAHVVRALRPARDVIVFDDLSTGRLERLPGDVPVIKGSLGEPEHLDRLLQDHDIDGVIHLAARKAAGDPAAHREVNTEGVRHLLRAMAGAGVPRLIFSSSAAVYGDVPGERAAEDRVPSPLSPYGMTKAEAERVIEAGQRPGFRSLIFRPFNVVGAGPHPYAADTSPGGLLPAVFAALTGGAGLTVTGTGLATADGTAVRDYVDVGDVARAYVLAVDRISRPGPSAGVFNLGSGTGSSVREVLRTVAAVTGRPVAGTDAPPRPGDPVEVVADPRRAADWGWASRASLADAVRSAWAAYPRP